eukprot:7923337-Pyramimonas_sp.AAC.1
MTRLIFVAHLNVTTVGHWKKLRQYARAAERATERLCSLSIPNEPVLWAYLPRSDPADVLYFAQVRLTTLSSEFQHALQ